MQMDRDGRRARGMRYASTRAEDVRRDALRHALVGDGSEAAAVKLREAIEAYDMTRRRRRGGGRRGRRRDGDV